MKPSDIIELFNDGEWEKISKFFNNDIMTFLKFSVSKGFSNRLDISSISWREFEENENVFDLCIIKIFILTNNIILG